MLVQCLEPQGRLFTNFQAYYIYSLCVSRESPYLIRDLQTRWVTCRNWMQATYKSCAACVTPWPATCTWWRTAALSVSPDVSLHSYHCVLDMYNRLCLPLRVFLSYRCVLDTYDRPCLLLRVFLSYRCVLDMYDRPCLPLRVFLSYRCVSHSIRITWLRDVQ